MSAPWGTVLIRNALSITSAHELPEMYTPGQLDTLVQITVEQVTGAPTTAQLSASFEVLNPTTGGTQTDAQPGGLWAALDADLHGTLLPDGDWPTTIADQTTKATTIDHVVTTASSTAISIGSGGSATAPFAVGQRISGSSIKAPGSTNIVTAIGSAGFAGTSGSSATLRSPAISSDSGGTGVVYTNPVTVLRRIARIARWRVVLTPTFTGGTAPAFVITVTADPRY